MVTIGTIMTMSRSRWSIAAAKAELSNVVRRAQRVPQVLENRGEPVAVLVGIDEYRRTAERGAATARWSAFLDLTAELRADGALEIEIPPRTTRASPFDGGARVVRRRR